MKTLTTTKGYQFKIDDEDYEWVRNYIWSQNERRHTVYVKRSVKLAGSSTTTSLYLHREIMERLGISVIGVEIDHRDNDGLNNQRFNLRVATASQNHANKRKYVGTTSSYRGVSFHKASEKWRAAIVKEGRSYSLGSFTSELEAAKAYNAKATELFGEFAKLNEV